MGTFDVVVLSAFVLIASIALAGDRCASSIKLEVTRGGLILLAVLMLTVVVFPGFGISAIAVVLIHELGHLLCATWIGTKIKAAGITGRGIYLRISSAVPRQNVSIALAGPLASLLMAIALPLDSLLAVGNMIMFLVNVLTLPGSDGRNVLTALRLNL